ncbi:hypothetical protein KDN32_17620 [Nocardioides sp. J2M5]|uniref:hypothetical protein n=1 Tax=Nocardioides palaemonis TaxID=2829810 RepID=UPI001BA4CFA3|nr:hypothetical protein [Nocardioides palaemonis]MBS2939562.1 hypothetical protein [Nocardioides palaemonis]
MPALPLVEEVEPPPLVEEVAHLPLVEEVAHLPLVEEVAQRPSRDPGPRSRDTVPSFLDQRTSQR